MQIRVVMRVGLIFSELVKTKIDFDFEFRFRVFQLFHSVFELSFYFSFLFFLFIFPFISFPNLGRSGGAENQERKGNFAIVIQLAGGVARTQGLSHSCASSFFRSVILCWSG